MTVYKGELWSLENALDNLEKEKTYWEPVLSIFGMDFNDDGTRIFLMGSSDTVWQFDLTTPYDVGDWSQAGTFNVQDEETNPRGLYFKPDGTAFFIGGRQNARIHKYTMSTAWDVTTAEFDSFVAVSTTFVEGLFFKPDGTKVIICVPDSDKMYRLGLTTAWDITTASLDDGQELTVDEDGVYEDPTDCWFDPTGTRMYVVANNGDHVLQYSLSTAWDLTTTTLVHNEFVSTTMFSMAVTPTGDTFFIQIDSFSDGKKIRQYEAADPITTRTGFEVMQAINAYPTARIDVNNRDWALQTSFNADLLSQITIYDPVYDQLIFNGELRKLMTKYQSNVFSVKSKAHKLLNQQSDFNPVKASGFIRYLGRDGTTYTLRDIDQSFGSDDELVDHFFHWQRADTKEIIVTPNDDSSVSATIRKYTGDGENFQYKYDDGAITEEMTEVNDIRQLYYSLPDGFDDADDNQYISYRAYHDSATEEVFYLRLDCYFSLKSGVSIAEIEEIAVEGAWLNLRRFGVTDTVFRDPFVGIYDPDNVRYEGDYVQSDDAGGRSSATDDSASGIECCPILVKKLNEDNVSGLTTPSNYIDSVATDGDWTLYRIRLMVASGDTQTTLFRLIIKLREIKIKLKLADDLFPDAGIEKISSHSNTSLTFGSFADGQPPIFDGASLGDIYLITDTLTNQIDELASDWGVTINHDITDSDNMALTADHTYRTRYDTLQAICDISNSYWYYDDEEDAYYIVSADNIVSTGVTITEDDIVDYSIPGAWSYDIDADNIRDTVLGKGKKNIGEYSVSTSPEFSHALGDEVEIISATDIPSPGHFRDFINSETNKYEKARKVAHFTLDYDEPNQSYEELSIGKSIAFVIADADIDHDSEGDGELLITNMQWSKKPGTQQRLRVTITAERRYS